MHRTVGVDLVNGVGLYAIKTLVGECGVHGGVILVAYLCLLRGHSAKVGIRTVAGDRDDLPVVRRVILIGTIIKSGMVHIANTLFLSKGISIIHHIGGRVAC